jgi:hypothetical protein
MKEKIKKIISQRFVGKYFRPIVLLCGGVICIFIAWILFGEVNFSSFWSGVESIFSIGMALIFVFLSFTCFFFIIKPKYGGGGDYYEDWGAWFYILIGILLIYFLLRLLSQWIGFDVLGYINYLFNGGDY